MCHGSAYWYPVMQQRREPEAIAARRSVSTKEESDAGLFVYMSFSETDPAEAEAALRELQRRYAFILSKHCHRICVRYPSLDLDGDALVNATFWQAYQRAASYRALDKQDALPEEHLRYTAAWLCRIAKHLLIDEWRRDNRALPYEREPSDPDAMSPADVAALLAGTNLATFESADKPVLAQAFASLPERAQIVVIWMLDKRQRSPGGKYMSRGAQMELARRLGTSEANIRQIWTRTLTRLGKAVKDGRCRKRGR